MPRQKQFPVIREVALTDAQAAALERHARYLGVPQSELHRALIDGAINNWMDKEMNHAKQP